MHNINQISPGFLRSTVNLFLLVATLLGASACQSLAGLQSTTVEVDTVEDLSHEQRLRKHIGRYAENYIGNPYAYGAKGPHSFDCSGFTSYILKEFNVDLLGSSMSQAKQGRKISLAEAMPGDIVYFETSSGRVNHVALVVANGPSGLEVIHATSSRGVVRDNISNSSYWAPRLAGARCVVNCRVGLASVE